MINQYSLNKFRAAKNLFILSFLALFLSSFNIRRTPTFPNITEYTKPKNIIKLFIDRTTTDDQLMKIKSDLKIENIDFSYTTVRNNKGEISSLSLHVSGGNSSTGEFSSRHNSLSDNDTISPTYIFIDTDNNSVTITNDKGMMSPKNDQSHVWIQKPNNEDVEKNMVIHDVDPDSKKQVIIRPNPNDARITEIIEKETNGFFFVETNGDKEPLIFIDSKQSNEKDLKTLDPSSIKSMQVLKGIEATKKYGDNAKHGVIEITTN